MMSLENQPATESDVNLLFDFSRAEEIENWFAVDDVVMGGVSSSHAALRPTEAGGTLEFSGVVSLENFGGFASIRTRPERRDLSAAAGLALRLKGDGKIYQLRLRTRPNYDGIAYRAEFETRAGEWQVIRFPFASFTPVFRGMRMILAGALNPSKIYSFGLMISGKQAGPFSLSVDWLGTFPGEHLRVR